MVALSGRCLDLVASRPEFHTRAHIAAIFLRLSRHPQSGNCAEEINLSSLGIEQAKRIGEAFRAHGIEVGEVLTSPYCRYIDTGKLAFDRATPVRYLMPPGVVSDSQANLNQEQVLKDIRNYRSSSNLMMITHDLNISDIVLEPSIAMGDLGPPSEALERYRIEIWRANSSSKSAEAAIWRHWVLFTSLPALSAMVWHLSLRTDIASPRPRDP